MQVRRLSPSLLNSTYPVTRLGFSSRTQSDTLPSIAYMVSRSSTASTPPSTPSASTSSSDEDEYLPGVTIQNRGGRKKRVEIVTSQEYLQRAEAERKAEKMLTPTQGQHLTRIQCASYAKEMLSNGFIRNHAVGITADDTSLRFQYYDRSKVVESKVSVLFNCHRDHASSGRDNFSTFFSQSHFHLNLHRLTFLFPHSALWHRERRVQEALYGHGLPTAQALYRKSWIYSQPGPGWL